MFLPRGKVAPGARTTLREASHQRLLMVPESCGLASATRALFRSRTLAFSVAPQRALGYHVLEQWSEAGLGSAILPSSKVVVRPARAQALVDAHGRQLALPIDISWLKRAAQTPAAKAFVAHLKTRD